jgi:2-(1,2-epoxy-1,2-dihydrophenyl)acetyl-CoA isomerase
VGASRARSILLTDRVPDAREALEMGVVATVVADDAVADPARRLAERLAGGPTAALGRTKRLLAEAQERGLDAHLEAEAASIGACADGPEGREGVTALRERRSPRFHGEH